MRWIVVGPANLDSFAENLADALRVMGHEVLVSPIRRRLGLPGRVAPLAREAAAKAGIYLRSPDEIWAVHASRTWRPDVLLAPTFILGDESLQEIARLGVGIRIAWWGDPPGNMKRMGLSSSLWTAMFFKDKDAAFKHKLLGRNSHHLHEAMNPRWHRPLSTQYSNEIAIVGNYYGFRQALIREMIKNGLEPTLYGAPIPWWSLPEVRQRYNGRYVTKDEKSRVFGGALACLNSFSIAEGNSLNCRAFEIAGAAGLQLIEHRSAIAECFEPGREILPFSSLGELKELVDRAAKDKKWAEQIRIAGMRRALAEHTYEHRINTMLQVARQS